MFDFKDFLKNYEGNIFWIFRINPLNASSYQGALTNVLVTYFKII